MAAPVDGPDGGDGLKRAPSIRVLVVDDDELVAETNGRMLRRSGCEVEVLTSSAAVLSRLARGDVDVLVSDIGMPGVSGVDLLRQVRADSNDVPVIFLTGSPRIEDAMQAVEHGAFRFLTKPITREALTAVVTEAFKWRQLTQASASSPVSLRRGELEERFARAVASIRMVYQPIVLCAERRAYGYEALMRSNEPTLPSPPAVLDAAEKLGSLHVLGRKLRGMVAEEAARAEHDRIFFVNLHPSDLADEQLYEVGSPLSRHAASVVLELTERASLEGIGEVGRRLAQLRAMGYRIAIDDLGAGYAGLSYFAQVKPDIVKIDMSLVRDIDSDSVKQRVVGSICELARNLSVAVVAEGIETASELTTLEALGIVLLQGYALARPGPPYPAITFP